VIVVICAGCEDEEARQLQDKTHVINPTACNSFGCINLKSCDSVTLEAQDDWNEKTFEKCQVMEDI
jgi:hypothetical protein